MNYMLAAADPMDEVLPHTLFHIGGLLFTNQMLMVVISAVLMICIFPALFSYANSSVPTGARNFFESIMEFLRVEVFRPALKEHADRFVPFLWTLFFFILFANLLGQIPVAELITVITGKESHLWGTATGTPITTGALAICAFIMIHVSGIMQIARSLMNGTYGHHDHHEHGDNTAEAQQHMRGDALPTDAPGNLAALTDPSGHYDDGMKDFHPKDPRHEEPAPHMNPVSAFASAVPLYIWNFAPHPFKPSAQDTGFKLAGLWAADIFMWSILLILELLGAVIKPFSLTIRLFANMIGGHIVLSALILMIPVSAGFLHSIPTGIPVTVLSLVIRVLELFVSFLQAYIFTFLVTLFIASAVAPEH